MSSKRSSGGKKPACGGKKRYTAALLAGQFLGMCGRTFRSFLFNVLMFGLGFAACYVYAVNKVNRAPARCSGHSVDTPAGDKSLESSLDRFRIRVCLGANGSNGCAVATQVR